MGLLFLVFVLVLLSIYYEVISDSYIHKIAYSSVHDFVCMEGQYAAQTYQIHLDQTQCKWDLNLILGRSLCNAMLF